MFVCRGRGGGGRGAGRWRGRSPPRRSLCRRQDQRIKSGPADRTRQAQPVHGTRSGARGVGPRRSRVGPQLREVRGVCWEAGQEPLTEKSVPSTGSAHQIRPHGPHEAGSTCSRDARSGLRGRDGLPRGGSPDTEVCAVDRINAPEPAPRTARGRPSLFTGRGLRLRGQADLTARRGPGPGAGETGPARGGPAAARDRGGVRRRGGRRLGAGPTRRGRGCRGRHPRSRRPRPGGG